MIFVPQNLSPLRGAELTNICKYLNVHRRWLGLEPDFLLRRRALKLLKEN